MVEIGTFTAPVEGVILKQGNVTVFLGQECLGDGVLFVSENDISWQKSDSGNGFSLEYPFISMHGISKDVSSFPHECVFCLVDAVLPGNTQTQENNQITEVRFVPQDASTLEKIYEDIAECQKNHPDPDEEYDDDEDEDMEGYQMYGEDSENIELSAEGQAVLERLAGNMEMPSQSEFINLIKQNGGTDEAAAEPGQFDDADQEEER